MQDRLSNHEIYRLSEFLPPFSNFRSSLGSCAKPIDRLMTILKLCQRLDVQDALSEQKMWRDG